MFCATIVLYNNGTYIHLGNVCVHSRMWRLCMNETIQERDVYDDYLYLSLKFPHHHCVHHGQWPLRGLLSMTHSCA